MIGYSFKHVGIWMCVNGNRLDICFQKSRSVKGSSSCDDNMLSIPLWFESWMVNNRGYCHSADLRFDIKKMETGGKVETLILANAEYVPNCRPEILSQLPKSPKDRSNTSNHMVQIQRSLWIRYIIKCILTLAVRR